MFTVARTASCFLPMQSIPKPDTDCNPNEIYTIADTKTWQKLWFTLWDCGLQRPLGTPTSVSMERQSFRQGLAHLVDTMRAGNHDRREMSYLHWKHWKLGGCRLFCQDSPTKSQSDEASHATYPCWLQTSPKHKHQSSFLPTPSNHKESISVYSLNEAVRTPVLWGLRWQISSRPSQLPSALDSSLQLWEKCPLHMECQLKT